MKNFFSKEYQPKYVFSRKETRFTLFDAQIYHKLKNLNENSFDKYNLLFTPWHLHGRDLRIKNIFRKFKSFKGIILIYN